jgi:hypothetical protein
VLHSANGLRRLNPCLCVADYEYLDAQGAALARKVVGFWSSMAKTQAPAPAAVWPQALPTSLPQGLDFLAFDGAGHSTATVGLRQHSKQQIEQCEFWDTFLVEKVTTECAPPGEWYPAC